jgi:hypothetical protein
VLVTFHKDEVPDIATAFMEVDFAYCDPTESRECVFVQARGVSGEGFRVRAALVLAGLIDPTILARRLGRLPARLDPLEQKRLHSWLKA